MKTTQKPHTLYVCTNCDAQNPKWSGQCFECQAWGTLVVRAMPGGAKAAGARASGAKALVAPSPVTPLSSVAGGADAARLSTRIGELDRVLGGGIVPGSAMLLGGEPGIGKSTLALMAAAGCAPALYVSGEESAAQVKQRADRLGVRGDALLFLGETDVDRIVATMEKERPALAVIDSVQTLCASDIPSEAGAANQVRGAVARLVAFAKHADVPVLLIGHVTKDGSIAGPKTLEHLVDAVLSFEGERAHGLRVLRSLKNRFGSTDECGMFGMAGDGLREITNPSAYLLEERRPGTPGSAVCCVIDGTRPMLIEIQALAQRMAYATPVRRASGMEQTRLEMLCAVLSRRGGVGLGETDVYTNAVGGLRVREPAADLAVCMAVASSVAGEPLPEKTAVWGEVGLGGEIRSVVGVERRLAEAAKLGMARVITSLPRSANVTVPEGLQVTDVKTLAEAVKIFG